MSNFSITGQFITKHIRDLWESKEYKQAIQFGLESLEGASISHIVEIIDGKSKLIGINDVELVPDGDFSQELPFIEILDYAMLPNNGYFRIYDEDYYEGQKIIRNFKNTSPTEFGDETRRDLIYKWNSLLPEVKNDLKKDITHWMSVYLRKFSDNVDVQKKASFYSINLVESEIDNPTEIDRQKFDKFCDKFHVYGDRESTWEQHVATRKMINEPSDKSIEEDIKKEFKSYQHDMTMKSDYGWLSPDGRFTVCNWAEHEVLASIMCRYFKFNFTQEQLIGKQLSDVLLKKGYVKIHRDDTGFLHFTHNNKLTPEQETKIDKYKYFHKIN
ncbi:MAG: hypothetical protein ACOCVF_00990 [bacterium]